MEGVGEGRRGRVGCVSMSAPQLGFLVVRSVSSSRDFEVSEKTSALVFSEISRSPEDESTRTKRKPNCGALINNQSALAHHVLDHAITSLTLPRYLW
jgi:hypothetical protein